MTREEQIRWAAFTKKLSALLDAEKEQGGLLDALLGYSVGRMLAEGSTAQDVRLLFEESLRRLSATLPPAGSA